MTLEIQQLKEKLKNMAGPKDCSECRLRKARVNYLVEDNAKLRKALAFYADRANWTLPPGVDVIDSQMPIAAILDEGQVARDTLDNDESGGHDKP